MGVPEKGITLALKDKTAVHADLLDCGDCIQDIYVYDVWNMDEQNIANDTNSKMFNRSAVTLAYIIDTAQFEADYGFPFPSIDGVSNNGMYVRGGFSTRTAAGYALLLRSKREEYRCCG